MRGVAETAGSPETDTTGMVSQHAAMVSGDTWSLEQIGKVVDEATSALTALQHDDGHLLFELEADATIPSEYIMLNHFLDEVNPEVEARLANYIRARQEAHGGWPLFAGGELDVSCTVKAYLALKLVGDEPEAPHMKRARDAVLARGGAARSNVFTRTALALFGQVPWRAVPSMPIEIMYLPRWFPFHLTKISYWSRTTLVPLLILMTLRPKARNPRNVDIRELFTVPPEQERQYFPKQKGLARAFYTIDRILKGYDWMMPLALRRGAIDAAMRWCLARLNGEDGLGAIFPPMANILMVLDYQGYAHDHPIRVTARKAVDLLLSQQTGDEQYCQPCVSPIWDTGLAAHTVMETSDEKFNPSVERALDWLKDRQILEARGDWADVRPDAPPGGWAFQYRNDAYPDVDDTAVVGMALHRADPEKYKREIQAAADWIIGMQCENGGWGSFDADNEHYYLNYIPFADHGALLDPPTTDVSARCVGFLCQAGAKADDPVVARALSFLRTEQEEDGSWFGRWGTNYIYGTWSALCAFNAAGEEPGAPHVRKAVDWLKARQRADGGWGETGDSYYAEHVEKSFEKTSTPSQTAWAVLGLMAAGEVESDAVKRGIAYLCEAERTGAKWDEQEYTAVGFPRVFYLRYHGYSAYFPIWALARYRTLMRGNERTPAYGI